MGSFYGSAATVGKLERQYLTTRHEKELVEQNAELYSLLVTTQEVEEALMKGRIEGKEYDAACQPLIQGYKMLCSAVQIPDLNEFAKQYNVSSYVYGIRRLHAGLLATQEHGTNDGSAGSKQYFTIQATQSFIAIINRLEMDMKDSRDYVLDLSGLVALLRNLKEFKEDSAPLEKPLYWLKKLAAAPGSYQLTEDEAQQLQLDIELAREAFAAYYMGR